VKIWPRLPAPLKQRFEQQVLASDARMNDGAAARHDSFAKLILPDLLARLGALERLKNDSNSGDPVIMGHGVGRQKVSAVVRGELQRIRGE
jgi:hypothetical protein